MRRASARKYQEFFTGLRDFPREGLYEAWQILETKTMEYREPGADLLPFIRFRWHLEQLPSDEQEAKYQEWVQKQTAKTESAKHEIWRAAAAGDVILPAEERARREWMNNKIKEDLERERHNNQSVTVYQS